MRKLFAILLNILGISLFFLSCQSTKYVPEQQHLLTKNTIYVNGKKNKDATIDAYLMQRPNQKFLWLPMGVYFYNLGSKNFEKDYDKWKKNHPKWYRFSKSVFSEKQVYGNRKYQERVNEWFFKKGDAPEIINLKKTKQTVKNLQQYLYNEGFLKAKVNYKIEPYKIKKAKVNYHISTGNRYMIDSLLVSIESKELDSIYKNSHLSTSLKVNQPLKVSDFADERNRLTELFRNSGVYRFNKNAIVFFADSTNQKPYKVDVEMIVNDSISGKPFKIQRVKNIKIYTDYAYNIKEDSLKTRFKNRGYQFISLKKLKYNPKDLLNSVFIKPGDVYSDKSSNLTRLHLRELNNFKMVDVRYKELEDDSLEALIYLTPQKKYSLGLNSELTHSNIKRLGISAKLSLLNRNVFKGAEILKISAQSSFFDAKDVAKNDKLLNAWEIGADVSFEIPRFFLPFNTDGMIAKNKFPKTIFTLGTSLQRNIGLDKQKFTGIINYTWRSSQKITHSVELLNAQYIRNLNASSYFNVYKSEFNRLADISFSRLNVILEEDESLKFIKENLTNDFEKKYPQDYKIIQNINERYKIITENTFIPAMAYSFTYNNSKDYKDTDFSFFRARLVSSGNITSLFTQKEEGVKTLFNTPFAQYMKLDTEFKRFWDLSFNSIIAFRTFLGVAVPYGNSEAIPFSRSYFIGGSNDLRAWKVYDLGPGSQKTGLEYNVGNLKFLASLEYRFNIANSLKGAIFTDVGNIWEFSTSTAVDTSKFNFKKAIEELAVGAGFGIRYDLSFLLLRLDLGFKAYEPYLEENKRWFQHFNFSNTVYNFGISYPF